MIDKIKLKNFGPIDSLEWSGLKGINVIIGRNDSGKTFLLKALYCAVKSLEQYKRNDEPRNIDDIVADRLHWTFQTLKFESLVRRVSKLGRPGAVKKDFSCDLKIDNENFGYKFDKNNNKIKVKGKFNREDDSIFLPPKEVLSIYDVILGLRDVERKFAFDDTYVELAKALTSVTTKGRNYENFAKARNLLKKKILKGIVRYDRENREWNFFKQNIKFSIHATAEGIKKIGILDTLLGNNYLTPNSIVFIDEPESALHPEAISKLMEIISMLADSGMQFFLATHSYFVIEKLHLIALQEKKEIPIIFSDSENGWKSEDLINGMPENSIIDESIRLYKEEMKAVMES